MGDFKIDIKNLAETLKNANMLPKRVRDEIDYEIIHSLQSINKRQRRLVRKDQGGLARSIGYERRLVDDSAKYSLFANSEHAGYIEFGTKSFVKVPPYAAELASGMIGTGARSSLKPKEAIFAWCKRKGIEEKYWYPIFVQIMVFGIKPKPFFLPPYVEEVPKLLSRIQRIVNDFDNE